MLIRLLALLLCLTCTPHAVAADSDGDLIPDETDNCPTIPNPAQNIPPIQLTPPLVSGGSLSSSLLNYVSPDSTHVVYRADQDLVDVPELYSVPISGGVATKLNGPLAPGQAVGSDYAISPDSTRVVYSTDRNGVFELFSVPIDGGASAALSPPGLPVSRFRLSPDSSRVAFLADQGSGVVELYSAPLTGGPATKLHADFGPGQSVFGVEITSDGARAVYRADQDTADVVELYSVPLTGGPTIKLSSPLPVTGDVVEFHLSPDGATVAYRASSTPGSTELFAVSSTGGGSVNLSSPFTNVTSLPIGSAFSPDSAWVVFIDGSNAAARDIYSVPSTGGTPTLLGGPVNSNPFPVTLKVRISPDSTHVAFVGGPGVAQELFSVPIAGGAPIRLNAELVSGGNVDGVFLPTPFSPDGQTLLYRADQDVDEQFDLYSVPIVGGASTRITEPFPGAILFTEVFLSPFSGDGSTVVYLALQLPDVVGEIFQGSISGSPPIRVSHIQPPDSTATLPITSPDRAWIIYGTGQGTPSFDIVALFSTPAIQNVDGDPILDPCDCAPNDPTIFPGALEINDGADNQCVGDVGFGIVDELSEALTFANDAGSFELSWSSQDGATIYDVARSSAPNFSTDCVLFSTVGTQWNDGGVPEAGQVFHYLARSSSPFAGSWGLTSSAERTVDCPSFSSELPPVESPNHGIPKVGPGRLKAEIRGS